MRTKLMVRNSFIALACSLSLAAIAETPKTFQVPPGDLVAALNSISHQAGVELLFDTNQLKGIRTNGVSGNLTSEEAIRELLRGTDLELRRDETTGAMMIGKQRPKTTRTTAAGRDLSEKAPMQVVPASETTAGSGSNSKAQIQSDGELEEVVVVGSRLLTKARESIVPVEVHSSEKIASTGASSLADFFNTLPEASVHTTNTGLLQQFAGATTVQLRGLPAGTTLILINGRRVESASGITGGGFFDLNSIPVAAIDRVEVMPAGSSAVYGGDALGGVINIVLKQGFSGFALDVHHGRTSDNDYDETRYTFSLGWKSDKSSVSLLGTYADNSELRASERAITANGDYSRFGGLDSRLPFANPGNVCTLDGSNLAGLNSPCAGIPQGSAGVGLAPGDFAETEGVLNLDSNNSYYSILAPGRLYGAYAAANYELSDRITVFAEALYHHIDMQAYASPPIAAPIVLADYPNNPFGQDVYLEYLVSGLGRRCLACQSMNYFRPLIGARGNLTNDWSWEAAAWRSTDKSDVPATHRLSNDAALDAALANGSFNPFQDGPGASRDVLGTFYSADPQAARGSMSSVNAFVRGPLLQLPAGAVQTVLGAEYQRSSERSSHPSLGEAGIFGAHRESEAAFAEIKVPILSGPDHPELSSRLSAQLAVRYDHYSDFGSRTSPAVGLEFRPFAPLLLRGSYSSTFKPPSLSNLHSPTVTLPCSLNAKPLTSVDSCVR